MKKIILFPIEVACRELPGKLLLAHKFAISGCIVFVGSKARILEFSKFLPEAIYFDKGYHENVSERIYDDLEKRHLKIVSLDEENAVDFSDYQQLNLRFPDHILKRFRLVFLWGEKQFTYLKNNRANLAIEKTFVTGHPRFELLSEKFRSIYQKDVDSFRKKYGNFILVNTNFGLGNNIKGDDFVVQNYASRFPQLESLIKYQKEQTQNFISLCKFLSSKLQVKIILRPHPEEDLAIYRDRLADFSNVEVIAEGSVIPWIIAADIMIHHDCTTAIECAMLGKNSLAYTKNLKTELVTDIPLKISYKYSDQAEILEHVKCNDDMPLKRNIEILNDYFSYNCSGVDKILEEVLELAAPALIRKRDLIYYQLISYVKELLRGIFKKPDKLFQKKINGLDFYNVQSILKNYNRIDSNSVKVKKINNHLFRIKQYQK